MDDSTWTWISGSHPQFSRGVYGEKGKPSVHYTPSARYAAVGWFDESKQELWVFGGYSLVGDYQMDGELKILFFLMNKCLSYDLGPLNDLWKYQLNDSTWTWMGGGNAGTLLGIYGEKSVPNTTNVPGARWDAVGEYDSLRGEFWLFGGYGYGSDFASFGTQA